MEMTRLRLVFEDSHILSKSQKSNGLKRSWILLKPNHGGNIFDLSSYLLHIFDLDRSCPNGLLLSMDGFVLPPFESTSILKDKDIVRVTKKAHKLSDIVKSNSAGESIEEGEIVDKQPVITTVPLLANEEFEKETGGYESEAEDHQSEDRFPVENSSGGNATSKKRKATKKLQSSERKKRRPMASEAVENGVSTRDIERPQSEPRKNLHKKEKVSTATNNPDIATSLRSAKRNDHIGDTLPSVKRCSQLQENGTCNLDAPHKPDGTGKSPSRSARRKKAKRQWLRELVKTKSKELNEIKPDAEEGCKKSVAEKGLMTLLPNQDIDGEDEVVPIVIRPGHIRFEPLGEDDAVQQNHAPAETFQWNGITSKKKGQKWGKEKSSFCRMNDYKDDYKECFDMPTVEKKTAVNDPVDFEKLAPLTTLPKDGDVIAYRLLELSSSWTPEISSFRVGKTSLYDPESNRIILIPIPEYPIVFEKTDDGDTSSEHPDKSIYSEDGSLEINFSSLVDIRVVEHGNSNPVKAVPTSVNETPVGNKDTVTAKEVNTWG